MKLLQILNEIEVINTMSYKIKVDGKILLVAPEDLDGETDWHEATEACKKLGPKWRLPTKDELLEMLEQLHEQSEGNFKDDWYWSSSPMWEEGYVWIVAFGNGDVSDSSKLGTDPYLVRPVRDI